MAENLLETPPAAAEGGDEGDAPAAAPSEAAAAETASASVPEKFLDPETGAVRVDALAKSYAELERKLGGLVKVPGAEADEAEIAAFRKATGVPDGPEAYAIECKDDLLAPDPEVNRRLFESGFTEAQAQVVYDLAAEKLIPVIETMAVEYEAQRQTERLVRHFGGEAKWAEIRDSLRQWGEANLPRAAFDALATTFDGVVAIRRMMEKGEPALVRDAGPAEGLSEESLRAMMRDPRYWRDRDAEWVRRVTEGFRTLYPGAQ